MIRLELVGDDSCTIQDQGTTTDSTRRLRDGHEDDQTAPPRRHSQQQQQQHVLLMSSMLKSEGADSTDADGSSSSLALSPNNNAVVSDSGMTGPLSATDAADPTARIRQTIVSFTSPPFFVSMESDGAAALSHESIVGPRAAGKRYLAQPRPSITDDLLIPTLTPQDGTTATMPTRLRALSSTCGSSPGLSWRLPQALRPAAADNDGENGTSPSPALRSVRSGFGRFFSFNSTSGTTQLLPPHALQSMRQHRLASLASLGGSFNPSAMNVGGDEGRYHGSPNAPTMREGLPLLATGFSSSTEESLSGTPAGPCGAGDAPTPPGVGVVVPGVLYVGSYRAFCDPIACHVLDIQAYLSVAAEVKPGLPPHVAMEDVEAGRVGFCKLQLLDNATTVLKEHLGAVFDFIDEQTQMGRPVALYCQAGKSRSVALAVAVVMREYGLPADGAFHLLKQRYPLAEPNVFFLDQLQNLCRDELHGGPA